MNRSHSAPAVLLVSRYCLVTVLTLGSVGARAAPSANAVPPANAPFVGAAPPASAASSAVPDPAPSPASSPPTSSAAESGSRPSQKFELSYTAPSECPARQEFIAWTDRFYGAADAADPATSGAPEAGWRAAPDELAGSIQIQVLREGSRYTAHLLMVSAGGLCPTVRPPHTETSCADAARAMAYSLAQALKAPPCAAAANLPKPASSRPAPPCTPSPRACPPASPRDPSPSALRGELGVAAGLVTPLAEDVAWGGALLVGFTTVAGSPSGRLAVGYWDAGTVPMGHDLRARLWSMSVSLCPFRVGFTRWLSLPLCATGEIGPVALSGVGSATEDATGEAGGGTEDADRANLYLWSSLGVSARLRAENSWLFAELEPNLVFPLFYHPVYVHQPGSEASERQDAGQVGQWGALKAHLNLGIVFP